MSEHETLSADEAAWVAEEATAALAAAREFYRGEGLRLPPLPRDLAARLFQFDTAEWALSDLPDTAGPDDADAMPEPARVDLTDLDNFIERAMAPGDAEALGFGHVGHGVASWWMCYQLLRGPLALFIRLSYGSVYGDADTARSAINATFTDAEPLIVIADAARASGGLSSEYRLVVVVDDRGGSFWGSSEKPEEWQETADPIGAATGSLQI